MRSNNEFTITSKQLIFIMIGAMLGSGILSLPRLAAKEAGQDAWFAVILGSLFPLVSICLIRFLYKKNKAESYVALCRKIGGRYLGGFFCILLAVYSLSITAVLLRVFIEVVSIFLLQDTPKLVKLFLMLSVCAYIAAGNAKVLGRVYEFLFYILLPLLLFSLPAIINNSDYLNLLPVFNHSISDYAQASLTTGFAFSGFELYLIFHPYVSREKEAFRASLYALLITLILYLYYVVSAILVFGPDLVQQFTWPTLRLLATAEIPVIERIEFLFIQAWIGVSFRPVSAQYYSASNILAGLLGLKSQTPVTLALFPLIIFIAYLPSDIFQVLELSDYFGMAALALGIGLPLLLIVVGYLSGLWRKGQNEKA